MWTSQQFTRSGSYNMYCVWKVVETKNTQNLKNCSNPEQLAITCTWTTEVVVSIIPLWEQTGL